MNNYEFPYKYLNDVVIIKHSEGSPYLDYIKNNNLGLVYYHLLDHLERNRNIKVTFSIKDVDYNNITYAQLSPTQKISYILAGLGHYFILTQSIYSNQKDAL